MNIFLSHLFICVFLVGISYYISNRIINISEVNTCPICYGTDYCSEFDNNVTLHYRSVKDCFFNLFSVKNVYFANSGANNLVIKKLGHQSDLAKLNLLNKSATTEAVLELLNGQYGNFQVCDNDTAQIFLQQFVHKNIHNLWTLVNINVEPLLLEIFRKEDNWPVPKLLGYCGRTVTIEDCGVPLNDLASFDWYSRAYVTLQLLDAANLFTVAHPEFRLYLTDISPDNIAVDPKDLRVSFVDLGNAILQRQIDDKTTHYSEHLITEDFLFSVGEICGSSISDHNIYAICRLLLAPSAPWPMMPHGLLHSAPANLNTTELFGLLEGCVFSQTRSSRFVTSVAIRELLSEMLENVDYFAKDKSGL